MEAITQFWQSVVQDDQLDQLTIQAQEDVGQLTMNTSLWEMPLMVQIMRAEEIKDLQQRASYAQEFQQRHHGQLDEFQEIGGQLDVKAVAMLQEVQENRQLVDGNAQEEHLMQQALNNFQSVADKVQLQVHEIAQQFGYFKAWTLAYTLLS